MVENKPKEEYFVAISGSINKVPLDYNHRFTYILSMAAFTMTELKSCDKVPMAYKAQNIYYLVLNKKCY